ncbi:MAG: hypothetical protein K6A82_02930 [Prevotella sp.]|nr:hypothetical protein [Prevotella sp.]
MASKTATTNRVTVISHDEMTEHLQLVQRTRNGSVFTSQHFSVVKSATFHIEDALEAMVPLRFHFMYVALVTEGRGEAVLNMQPMSVGEGDLFFANYGTIVGGGHTAPYLTYNGFSLTEEYLHMVYGNDIPGLFLDPERCLKARLTVAERTTFNSYLTTLLRLLHLPERNAVAVRSLFTALLNFVCSLCECHCKEQTSLGEGKSLQLSFYQLVRKTLSLKETFLSMPPAFL